MRRYKKSCEWGWLRFDVVVKHETWPEGKARLRRKRQPTTSSTPANVQDTELPSEFNTIQCYRPAVFYVQVSDFASVRATCIATLVERGSGAPGYQLVLKLQHQHQIAHNRQLRKMSQISSQVSGL